MGRPADLCIPLIIFTVLIVGSLQTISWPSGVTNLLSPAIHSAYSKWIPPSIDQERQAASLESSESPNERWSWLDPMTTTHPLTTGRPIAESHPLSVNPWMTRRALYRPAVFGLIVLMGTMTFRNPGRIKIFLALTGFFGAVLAFFGLADTFTVESAEPWIDVATQTTSSFASFVNRNNAGGYLNLTLASTLGYFVWRHSTTVETARRQRGYRRTYDTGVHSATVIKLRKLVAVGENAPITLLSALITIAAIVACGSRGAVLGTLAGLLAIGLVRFGKTQSPAALVSRIAIILFVLMVVGVVSTTDLAGSRIATLWNTDLAEDGRLEHWSDGAAAAVRSCRWVQESVRIATPIFPFRKVHPPGGI